MTSLQPILFVAFSWWFSTGIILLLVRSRHVSNRTTAIGASVLLIAATAWLVDVRFNTNASAAYFGFMIGLASWAWHEVMFLLGFISGPRKSPCPPQLPFWRRFTFSAETVIHHEVAILLHAGLLVAMSWSAPNKAALFTFLTLWGMRLIAKLIIFAGAPNITEDFLPAHLGYLKSYFRKGPINAFFPVAISASVSIAVGLAYLAAIAPQGSFTGVIMTLTATLAAFALFEHAALGAPLPDAALWRWALPTTPNKNKAQTGWSE